MIDLVKRFFGKVPMDDSTDNAQSKPHDLRVATTALFLEMARIDESFSDAEMDTILAILKEKYGLSAEHTDALIQAADEELEESLDLWQFAKLINENYTRDEKEKIIEMLWQIVFVDGKLDKYENYLMHKMANLLRLSHNQLIAAKLKVLGTQ
ncbi:MAG: TerB family tellurite resistance protein [Desulfobacterales bacterium]|nr:TerB family tellurite resistance protein [Desulfobacterales bacterium]MDJ0915918.1 TerB family tellurite resistance protein [Desulfobacterales bacterium]